MLADSTVNAQWAEVPSRMPRRGGRRANHTKGIADLPGFDDSLRLLLSHERYSTTDVALMFNVSRERMRQLCEARGIEQPMLHRSGLKAVRVWDDSVNRFRPIPKGLLKAERAQKQRERRLRERISRRSAKQREIITTVRALYATLGREPTWFEIAQGIGLSPRHYSGSCQLVMNMWQGRRRGISINIAAFRRAVGLQGRPSGAPGHIRPYARRTNGEQSA